MKTSYLNPAELGQQLELLQRGQHSMSLYLEQMCRRIDHIDPEVKAMLPESDRLHRLRAEAALLRP